MDFIANYWLLWVIIMVACIVFAFANQMSRMKRVGAVPLGNVSRAQDEALKGFFWVIAATVVGWVAGVLLALSIVVNLIRYFRG